MVFVPVMHHNRLEVLYSTDKSVFDSRPNNDTSKVEWRGGDFKREMPQKSSWKERVVYEATTCGRGP